MAGAPTVGWIGTGRMGYQLALRLLTAGYDVAACNRTRAKASRSPGRARRSSPARRTSRAGTSSSSWSRPTRT